MAGDNEAVPMGDSQRRALREWDWKIVIIKDQIGILREMLNNLSLLNGPQIRSTLPGDKEYGYEFGTFIPDEVKAKAETAAAAVFALLGVFDFARMKAETRYEGIATCPPEEWDT